MLSRVMVVQEDLPDLAAEAEVKVQERFSRGAAAASAAPIVAATKAFWRKCMVKTKEWNLDQPGTIKEGLWRSWERKEKKERLRA